MYVSPSPLLSSLNINVYLDVPSLVVSQLHPTSSPTYVMFRYDFFKTNLLHRTVPLTDYRFREGLPLHVAASILAGTVATSA